jgi:hypothetical protein
MILWKRLGFGQAESRLSAAGAAILGSAALTLLTDPIRYEVDKFQGLDTTRGTRVQLCRTFRLALNTQKILIVHSIFT